MRFGRLTVVSRAENKGHNARWNCRCDCGSITVSHTYSLTGGHSKSCGCLNREHLNAALTTHGGRHTKLYGHWCHMRTRCNNAKHEHYAYYGGRGIKVCDEWALDFKAFRDWAITHGYQEGLSIDRIDVNGDYKPDNCKWSTQTEQVRNRSNTVFLAHGGLRKPLKEWCESLQTNYKTAHARYKRGMPFEQIFGL